MPSVICTFLLLAVAADVGVVAVQRACGHMRPAAVVLSIQRVDGDVDQMEHHLFTHVHVSVWILKPHSEEDAKIPEFLITKTTVTYNETVEQKLNSLLKCNTKPVLMLLDV